MHRHIVGQLARKSSCSSRGLRLRQARWLAVSIALFSWAAPAFATTLVVKLENDRILLAADTRQERFNPGPVALVQSRGEDGNCKVRVFGDFGFAVTGFVEYRTGDTPDSQHDWSAYADASGAFVKAGSNIRSVAAEWAQRMVGHFSELYRSTPEQLKQLAAINPDNLLQVALFAGWENRRPALLLEIVALDAKSPQAVTVREIDGSVGMIAFSSNGITQELIEGKSDRAQRAADEWDELAVSIPTAELAWRHVEFYVRKTASFDPRVSPSADVLSIPMDKAPAWIQRAACL